MDIEQEAVRRFVREILRVTGWTPSALAKRARLAHTTLTRFLNAEVGFTLSTRTIGKVRMAAEEEIPREQLDTLWLLSRRTPAQGSNASSLRH